VSGQHVFFGGNAANSLVIDLRIFSANAEVTLTTPEGTTTARGYGAGGTITLFDVTSLTPNDFVTG
jgi:hypothetical protein